MTFKTKNYGVIPGRKSTDWAAGSIPHEVREPDGNWPLVRAERQRFRDVETMSCVSFASLSAMEVQILAQTGVEVNFSDRFLARSSGTTRQGNRVSTVLDTLRHVGAVLEDEWPVPPEPFGWDNYHSEIPGFITARGRAQFLDKYHLAYEYVPEITMASIRHHLLHAPLVVTVPGHAMLAVGTDGDRVVLLDTYPGTGDYIKRVRASQLTDVFKAVLTVKSMNQTKVVVGKDGRTVYKCVPVATSWDELVRQSAVEGITVPSPVPPASDL